ncbi:MAG TPA: mannose-6-phosphate isomerase, class I [Flavisolibacter sp.]|jgi:mannose-6-phosphate isomerase|nr:mannose-6-phosphate isomerase, class I [Flavisolibacter sp.]
MAGAHKLFKIKGIVQHYSWGGQDYIPALLNQDNAAGTPHAEYWLGAHPNHPSLLEDSERPLLAVLEEDKEGILGRDVVVRFDTLPFLFKILDVKQMLSIQVHPSIESARKGFALENQMKIPVTAPHRNYKDENHKPEMMVALSPFWLLHGFKPAHQVHEILQKVPELRFLAAVFGRDHYQELYELIMRMPQEEVDRYVKPLLERIVPLYEAGLLTKDQEDFWAARAAITFQKNGHADRGIFSIYLFNLLHLEKGEGIFQPSGMPHAYLEGQNVEVMANSDNVLRAGLTDKHIDVGELMKHVQFEATIPQVLNPPSGKQRSFETPAHEFGLLQYQLAGNEVLEYTTHSAELLFLLNGTASVSTGSTSLSLKKGEAAFAAAGLTIQMMAGQEAEIYRVFVPPPKN